MGKLIWNHKFVMFDGAINLLNVASGVPENKKREKRGRNLWSQEITFNFEYFRFFPLQSHIFYYISWTENFRKNSHRLNWYFFSNRKKLISFIWKIISNIKIKIDSSIARTESFTYTNGTRSTMFTQFSSCRSTRWFTQLLRHMYPVRPSLSMLGSRDCSFADLLEHK